VALDQQILGFLMLSLSREVLQQVASCKTVVVAWKTIESLHERPLKVFFSNVWGPTPDSIGGKKYYVSFIDDFNKFTWIYLLKFKCEVIGLSLAHTSMPLKF
jgi:hypothetical protein